MSTLEMTSIDFHSHLFLLRFVVLTVVKMAGVGEEVGGRSYDKCCRCCHYYSSLIDRIVVHHLLTQSQQHHYSLTMTMPMSSTLKIVSLPLNFSTRRCVESDDGPGGKQIKRKSSAHTVQTEECSVGLTLRCSSFNTLSDLDQETTKFNDESFQFLNSDSDEGDDAAMEALNQLSGLQTAAAEAKFNVLTRKLARLKKESRREERMLRKMERQVRINKAREDYLECLEAMSSTDLQSKAPELLDDAFLKEKGLQWNEIEFDDL
jgi:hypothetical protein